jgi:hypothetical protein
VGRITGQSIEEMNETDLHSVYSISSECIGHLRTWVRLNWSELKQFFFTWIVGLIHNAKEDKSPELQRCFLLSKKGPFSRHAKSLIFQPQPYKTLDSYVVSSARSSLLCSVTRNFIVSVRLRGGEACIHSKEITTKIGTFIQFYYIKNNYL